MKKIFIFLMLAILSYASKAQFVKQYFPGPGHSLVFNCITKAQNGNYIIAGIEDTSVYICEISHGPSPVVGTIIREKLIGATGFQSADLCNMITDANGNFVIVGSINLSKPPYKGFVMKISPALSLVFYKEYSHLNSATGNTALLDIKDLGPNNVYYLCGQTDQTNNRQDALLLTINRNTGNVINIFNGAPSATPTNSNTYDALVLDSIGVNGNPQVYATGRLSNTGSATFRPWVTNHNITTLAFNRGEKYVQTTASNTNARLYGLNIIEDNSNLVYCWTGDLVGQSPLFPNVGLNSVSASNLIPSWQNRFTITPQISSSLLFHKVVTDGLGNYFTKGQWNSTAIDGEMFIIKTNGNGLPLWGRSITNVLTNSRSHNGSIIADNGDVYAVGYKTARGGTNGVFVKILANGSIDTVCAKVLTINVETQKYYDSDRVNTVPITMNAIDKYFPVDCIASKLATQCDSCVALPDTLNADYELTGTIHTGNTTTFDVTATAITNSPNSQWIITNLTTTVSDADALNGPWSQTIPTHFGGYPGTPVNFGFGVFNQGTKYRFQHILSATSNCGIQVNDTLTKVIYMCTTCRNSKGGFIIVNEGDSRQNNSNVSALSTSGMSNSGKAKLYPDPANNTIIFNLEKLNVINPVLQIVTSKGQIIYTEKLRDVNQTIQVSTWASGSYNYSIISKGKMIDSGNFVVEH